MYTNKNNVNNPKNNWKTVKTVMTLTWYSHFKRNGGLNQILMRQTSRFHYGSMVPAVGDSGLFMEMVHDRCSIVTEFGTPLTTILPILFQYCYKYCYSDSRNH
jgi:hypothetical protein